MTFKRHAASIVEVLKHRAHHQNEKLLFTYLRDGELHEDSMSYGMLDRKAQSLAAALARRARPGDRVLIVLQPGLRYIVALFACFFARLVAVPAFSPRPGRHADAISAICQDCHAAVMLTDFEPERRSAVRAEFDGALGRVQRLVVDDDLCSGNDAWDGALPGTDSLALLQYTSGSTGHPKGVMITHGNIIDNLEAAVQRFSIGSHSRGVTWLPPFHDMGLIAGTLQPVYSDCSTVVLSPVHAMQRPMRWLKAIHRTAATISGGPPFAFENCLMSIDETQRRELDLTTWDCAFVGAEPIRFDVLERFARAFAPCGFRPTSFAPCYGLAEATLMVTGRASGKGPIQGAAERGAGSARVTCGHAIAGHEVTIVEPQQRVPCADGQEGEIWVRGPSIATGYWKKPVESEAVFAAYLADGRGPYLRTGDLGIMNGGELTVTGRLKELVIVSGRNLHPEDIEATTCAITHDRLRHSAHAAFAAEIDGSERLVVAVELRTHPKRICDEIPAIRAAISAAVVRSHGVSVHEVVFVGPGEMPRTSSGKIRRHLCRSQFLSARDSIGMGKWSL